MVGIVRFLRLWRTGACAISFELDEKMLARINEYLEDRIGTEGIHPMEDLPDFMIGAKSISDAVEDLIKGKKFGERWCGLDLSDEFFSMINGQFFFIGWEPNS